ncbi:tripartite motif-containing protein 16-like isoform X3 [Brienomyrus brachyistius]|uniref:tripartite motif-containing protein 16-like isoform X3 n=1 Tax=Brienomyrus brachyistius TaxID=42636 RepID=UPI0020B3B742|nr:tripartite motif-containing protein 16-like isoform X3 [Brienomyrus brachyistius]
MADTGNLLSKVQFSCPICLDLLKDPVTLPCGHSYCMNCIKSCWDKEDLLGVYSCPQCRQTFKLRPDLKKSTILAEVVEKLKNTRLHATAPADHYAGPGDVECDFCTGRKHKAVKSCLVCLASYCESHLQPHYTSPAFKKHKLADATGHLQDKVCSQHDKLLEVYCRTDQQCVCLLCVMDEHRGHDTVSAAAGRTEKQKQQEIAQKEFQKWIQERENELQEMKKAVNALSLSAQSAVEESERTFTEMICSIERRRSEVTKLIRDQEKAAVNQAEGHMKRLEQEIDELKRKHSELEQLSHTEDHIHFLQGCQIPCVPLASAPLPSIPLVPSGSFENVKKALFDLKAQLERSCKDTLTGMSQTVKDVCVLKAKKCTSLEKENHLQKPEPRTRDEFLRYACHLTLDPNTVNKYLCLSEGNRVVTRVEETQSYPEHPDRFEQKPQVLCTESLSGRHYWEIEWSGNRISMAVSYRGISRKGGNDRTLFGYNDKSWSLYYFPSMYNFWHNNKCWTVSGPRSSRIGVYLDHGAGTLCFYSVSDTMTLLHRVQTTFTEPLYAGFYLYGKGTTIKLCSLSS